MRKGKNSIIGGTRLVKSEIILLMYLPDVAILGVTSTVAVVVVDVDIVAPLLAAPASCRRISSDRA